MKRYILKGSSMVAMAAAVSLVFLLTGTVTAKSMTTKDEKKLTTGISMIDKDASLPHGDTVVSDRLSKEFNISGDQIKGLRDKGLKHGEIAAVYSFADKMPGGMNDDNVSKVMSMREGKKGWGEIAKSLNVDLAAVASKVDGIEKDAHKDIKKAATEKTGSGAGGGMSEPKKGDGGGGGSY